MLSVVPAAGPDSGPVWSAQPQQYGYSMSGDAWSLQRAEGRREREKEREGETEDHGWQWAHEHARTLNRKHIASTSCSAAASLRLTPLPSVVLLSAPTDDAKNTSASS